MQKHLQLFAAALAAIAAPGAAMAQTTGISVGPSAGTDGIGADAFYKISPFVAARAGFRYADISISKTIDDVRYDLDFGFTGGLAALDIHPFANGFRVSGGAYFSGRNVDLGATPARPVEIGDRTYTPAEVGVLTGSSDWNNAAPFLGLGFNNGLNAVKRFGFQAMLGAAYIGDPDVTLEATGGLLASDPTFQADLDKEEQRLADDLDDFPFHPILSLGFTVRF
ncbi:hypothetical protein [Hyphococcus luteus]|uniref:Outer membrane protein beta-barrel domain-containing protein n=1 Tax=Hyphococcus luteus TaxID=2058213 RepID=A0A2S7K7L1_9PROT|nr:hypothetical protein [Marinicaulis flavus]PQA88490.1 hypothetical protein CW354_09385 [Marinicaulis flavus]